ncbi:hypothetical protein [Ochrobactrum sp. S1502_03]|uniref:hypothetical protein n=1 Tax=Ochrobactrum sp. S1502_03 TaxID=3108451 RepID=UPI0037C7A987
MIMMNVFVAWRIKNRINEINYLNFMSLAYGQGVINQLPLIVVQIILCFISFSYLMLLIPILIYELILTVRFKPFLSYEHKFGRKIKKEENITVDYYWILPCAQAVEIVVLLSIVIMTFMTGAFDHHF